MRLDASDRSSLQGVVGDGKAKASSGSGTSVLEGTPCTGTENNRSTSHAMGFVPVPGDRSSIQDYDGQRRTLPDHHHVPNQFSWFVLKLTVTSALGGFLFGYDTGVVSGAMLLIKKDFDLTDWQQEVVVTITIVGAVAASLVGGPAMEHWGRRPLILSAAVIFTVGAVLLAAARSYPELVIGRLVVGVGIGFASLTTPVYIAEAAPTGVRGTLVTVNTLFITCGQVVAGVVDGLFAGMPAGWRYMLGLSGIPSLLMTIGFLFLPESPRWLVGSGRRREALSVLQTIRGSQDVHVELEEMVDSATDYSVSDETGGIPRLRATATVRDLLEDPRTRRALVLGCGLQMLQQLSGINTVMYYSASIFKMAGFSVEASIWLAALTAASQSVGVCFGLYFIEIYGRRMLVLSSLGLVVAALVCLGTGFRLSDASDGDDPLSSSTHHEDEDDYGFMVVLAMVAYLLAFGIGMSSIPWTINAEIYPTHVRSLGTSASTTTNWLGNVAISATFLTLANDSALGRDGAFYLYATIGVAGWVWLYGCMPETKGLSLEEIELLFAREGDPPRPGEDGMTLGTSGNGGGGIAHVGGQRRPDGFALLDGNSSDESGIGLSSAGGGSTGGTPVVYARDRDPSRSWVDSGNNTGNPTMI